MDGQVGEIRVDDTRSGPTADQRRERRIAAIEVRVTPFEWGLLTNEDVMGMCEPEKEIGDGGWTAVEPTVPTRGMGHGWVVIKDRGERLYELIVRIHDFAEGIAVIHDVATWRHGRNES